MVRLGRGSLGRYRRSLLGRCRRGIRFSELFLGALALVSDVSGRPMVVAPVWGDGSWYPVELCRLAVEGERDRIEVVEVRAGFMLVLNSVS
jgi:hypothetical protein